MVTFRIAKQKIKELISDLQGAGYSPSRAGLFGSFAKQKAHELSDIDVAIWDKKFTGCAPFDYEASLKFYGNIPV